MKKASIRQLRTEFPKVRKMIQREGAVIVTERGQEAYLITPYRKPKAKRPKTERLDYMARLRKVMPRPISAETERMLDADRGDY